MTDDVFVDEPACPDLFNPFTPERELGSGKLQNTQVKTGTRSVRSFVSVTNGFFTLVSH
jgi:hypothetical protein